MNLVKYMNQNKLRFFLLLFVFFLSETAMVTPLVSTTNSVSPLQIQNLNNQITPLTPSQLANTPTTSVNLKSSLDQALFDWVNASKPLDPSLYKMDVNYNPIITVFAPPGSNLQSINNYMNVNSFIDLGEYGLIILGSVSSATNLLSMVSFNPLIKVSSDPLDSYLNTLFANSSISQPISNSPNQFVSQNTMGITQANTVCENSTLAFQCNGAGVTIAMVDGGVDFGNSDLSNASALDANGLPMSFDTEGWSLVATPLTVGKDIPISKDNTTLLFNNVPTSTLDKLQINDPGNVAVNGQPILDLSRGWEYWHNVEGFMSPQNWKINASWINQPGQAPPKFGIGVEQWKDLYTGKIYPGYFYALLIDLDRDGQYDSAVIDMATSAWATYLKYISDGGTVTPMSQIQPDFNFANDKIVSWFNNIQRNSTATGSSYTFAVDWNGDGINDWSYGSMASAYNRWNFLPINQTQDGKIIHGVDPQGSGFVALYPFGYGFSEHGTFTSSVAVSRGLVPYNVFSNNTGSWDYPYGNSSTRTLPGAASGASLMSVSWGSSPQDELLAWFWAAGFNLNTTIRASTADITGAQWVWSGHVRANITSNSWGIGGLYWGGFWGTDWISDLLSMPNLGGNSTYVRKITDIWSAGVLDGPNTGQNLGDVNYSSPFIPFTNGLTNNTLYIGSNNPYVGVGLNVSIPASAGYVVVAKYYNGANWVPVTVTTNLNLTEKGITWLKFTTPADWKLTNITQNGQQLYWIQLIESPTNNPQTSNLQISNILFEYKNPYEGYPGMLMVVAAGNDNYYQSTASPFGTLTLKVGASSSSDAFANLYGSDWGTTSDQMAYFSSAGPKANGVTGVDIVAPGYYVYSGTPLYHSVIDNSHGQGDITSYGGNGQNAYIIWAGTSAATPAIAGVAAIAYQAYIAKHPGVTVNPNLIKQIIKSTATNLEYPSNIQGAGFVNASAIVDYILNPSTSPYFVTGSNTTYEDQLASNSWLSNIGQFYWYYAYSAGDSFADVHDFPVSNDSLLSYSHYDTDLSTSTVTQGATVNTQVAIQNSTGNVEVSAVHPVLTNTITPYPYVINTTDSFLGPYGDYLVNISLANLPIWNSDYIQITVTNIPDFNTLGLYVWHDFNHDGKIETANQTNVQTNGAGELGKVQIEGTQNKQSYGVLQIGNPGQYHNSYFTPFLILRGNPELNNVNKSNWALGDIIGVSIKTYNLYSSWSNAITSSPWKTVNGISYWNVSIDTTNMPAGYNLGYLNFTNIGTRQVELMPLSVKVGFRQIDQTDPSTNPKATPTVIGTYNLDHLGSTYQIGFQGGSMIWVPFAVNESKTTTSDVLAIRVTQVSGNDANIGFVLHYDATPNYFDASWFQIFTSQYNTGTLNGQNVNWQYIPWSSVGFEKNAFISRFGYFRYQSATSGGIVNYRIGLFTTNATSLVSVKLEMYWLPGMPSITSDIATKSSLANYCQDSYSTTCLSASNILFGPNADLELTSKCTQCDPNLPSPTVVFGVQQAITNLTTGNFPYGIDPSYSVDYWEKRTFQAGDLVEFSLLPTNPSALFEVFIYTPDTIALFNQSLLTPPVSDIAFLLSADYNFLNGGSFIAPTTGQYWFGIDNVVLNGAGTSNTGWILYTKASRGPLYDTGTNSTSINTMTDTQDGFGLPSEATYNVQTGIYDNVTNVVLGANSPTGLSNGLYSVNIAVDNYVAPFVTLGNESLTLNNTVIDRRLENNITFDWSLTDLNNNVAYSHIIFEGPFSNDVIQDAVTSTSYTMSLSNLKDNGWWTIIIIGDDSLDPANTINGVDYGGPGFPVFFRVFIQNSQIAVTTQTVSEPGPQGLLTPFGYGVVGVILGVGASTLGALTYIRRVEVKSKYNEIKSKVSNEINKRRGPKT